MPIEGSPAKQYHQVKHQLFFVSLLLDVALLILFFKSGLSVDLREWTKTASPFLPTRNAGYLFVFGTGMSILHFPFRYFEDYRWEHRFNLSNQTFLAWLKDDFKKGLVSAVVGIAAVTVIYEFLHRFPGNWWVGAGIFWLLLTLVLARITPNVIIPLFYKYSPIENPGLRESVLKLFKESDLKIKNAYLVDFSKKTKKANAFICGLGKSRRVVLSDNLVNSFSIPEIEAVVAHEIGHYKHHDMLKLTVVNSAVTFIGFYLVDKFLKNFLAGQHYSIDDIAAFPIVILVLSAFSVIMMPLLNGFSRRLEVAADRFSLTLTQNPKDFMTMMKKLGDMNLADKSPSAFIEFMFYTHPPIAKRIRLAEEFQIK